MEIVFEKTAKRSNFDFINKLFKGKKVLNGFNRLSERLLFEPIISKEFEVQNIIFEKEIIADLYLSYPFKVVVKEEIKFNSLHQLITSIRNVYKKIYKEESKSLTKIDANTNLYNRGESNGKYGIWGHEIYDLTIESIRILEGKDRPLIEVGIGS